MTTVAEQTREPVSATAADRGSGDRRRIRLVLLDSHALFRASLAHFLASECNVEITGTCGNCAEALTLIQRGAADILILDLALANESGISFLMAARQHGFAGRFLILTNAISATEAARALKLGASGIFLKSNEPERLIDVVHFVAQGEVWIDRRVVELLADRVIDPASESPPLLAGDALPDREQKVLAGIAGGLSNRKIGESIRLSESSVKAVIQRLFARAGVRTRSQLVRLALEGSFGQPAAPPTPSGVSAGDSGDRLSIGPVQHGFPGSSTKGSDTARARPGRSVLSF